MTPNFTGSPDGTGQRNVLLLSYHFPPGTAAGALRWEKMAAGFVEAGWGVDVVTAHPDLLPEIDPVRREHLPAGVRVHFAKSRDALWVRAQDVGWRVAKRLRGGPGAPDADPSPASQETSATASTGGSLGRREIHWDRTPASLKRAYGAAREQHTNRRWAESAARQAARLRDETHCIVISCGPPHQVHTAASVVARRLRLPHLADLRDPWGLQERLPSSIASPLWYRFARRQERFVLRHAAAVSMNTDAATRAMQAAYPEHAGKIFTVMNGCDDESIPAPPADGTFRLRFAGSIYLDRDPRPLFRAVRTVVDRAGLTPGDLMVELMGHVEWLGDTSVAAVAADLGLAGHVRLLPAAPRHEAVAFLAGASVAVNLAQDSLLAIPSKIYEYLQLPVWILALDHPGAATGELLQSVGADVVAPDDPEGIASAIERRYRQWERGERPRPLRTPRVERRTQNAIMVQTVERLTNPASG